MEKKVTGQATQSARSPGLVCFVLAVAIDQLLVAVATKVEAAVLEADVGAVADLSDGW